MLLTLISMDCTQCSICLKSYKVSDPTSEIYGPYIAELMVLGFISLLLTFGQNFIVKICIPEKAADTMLPCPYKGEKEKSSDEDGHRRLLWYNHRFLSTATSGSSCKEVSGYFLSNS